MINSGVINTVLFDLDGTLVDTAPDLGYALNLQLARHGKPTLPDDVIRPVASHGSRGLLGLGFGVTPQDAEFSALREEYLDLYDQVFTRSPRLFDGIAEVLQQLEVAGLKWGIVTNKPKRFTDPLVKALDLYERAAAVVSGDEAKQPKPAPDTLLLACQHARVQPSECLYVGDAERDVVAGKAAGMKTAVALFGYIAATDQPQAWGADALVASPQAVLNLIR